MNSRKNLNANADLRVLVVDDEASIADFVAEVLSSHDYRVDAFSDSEAAFEIAGKIDYDLALVDINMPVVDGVKLARKVLTHHPDTEIVIITGIPDEKNLDSCLELGLTHFLFKPFNEFQLLYTVYAALHVKRLKTFFMADSATSKGSNLVGISAATRRVRQEVLTVATIDLPVLITGESGTGKEIIARDIHRNSDRRDKNFIAINCALLGSIAESELFGHASGSFTGATRNTSGYIGEADGGVLFLDEVAELSMKVQAKLLRFLDNGEYRRVGEAQVRQADIRIIAATNKSLEQMCEQGTFRDDLFYRLSGGIIRTAPLRERKADTIPLVWHFLSLFGTARNITCNISAEACNRLAAEDWPGNVRQLKQTLYKISQVAAKGTITLADVERELGGQEEEGSFPTYKEAKQAAVHEFDREYLLKTLALARGSAQEAIRLSGMHKKNFYTKLKSLGLAAKDFLPG